MILSRLKTPILVLLFFCSLNIFSQQKYYTFSEIRGLEDGSGNTHLFYRKYFYEGNQYYYTSENNIFHLNLHNNTDQLFLSEYASNQYPNDPYSSSINDYEFWDSDPQKYIYVQVGCGTDCVTSIFRFDSAAIDERLFFFSSVPKICISSQNDSVLYVSASHRLTKSTDGGRNWSIVDSTDYLDLLSISKYNDKEIFSVDSQNNLEKSSDGGLNFYPVDTTNTSFYPVFPEFIYDPDSLHIYRTSSYYNGSGFTRYLSVSDNHGEADSWTIKYTSNKNIYISSDPNISGTIYLADNNKILLSTDFGNTFDMYQTLDSLIVGIFKKPASDIIYAATKYNIYEITSSSIKSIKSVVVAVDKERNEIPLCFSLSQNYPNPFNPSTIISYEIPKASLVTIKVYDVLGREVATLINEEKPAGIYKVTFDASKHSSGVYFYVLKSGTKFISKKMCFVK